MAGPSSPARQGEQLRFPFFLIWVPQVMYPSKKELTGNRFPASCCLPAELANRKKAGTWVPAFIFIVWRGEPPHHVTTRLVRYRTDNLLGDTMVRATLACIVVITTAPGTEKCSCRTTITGDGWSSQR
jgi:hypothetical protein